MSDEPKPTRRFDPTDGKGVPWPFVLGLLGVGLGGGGGSLLSGNALAAELREFRVEVRTKLESLEGDREKVAAIEERVRKVEIELAASRGGKRE